MAVAHPTDTHSINSAANGTDDREACPEFWIAAYTRPNSEKKAATELANHSHYDITTYVATQTIVKQWSDRKKKIESVVIPMIIFAKVSSDEEILTIKRHPLILKILTLPGHHDPAHIPDSQIKQLQLMLKETDQPVEFVQGNFKVSDHVKVIKGRLCGLVGYVEHSSAGKSFITITIDLLGGAKAMVNPADLELIQFG